MSKVSTQWVAEKIQQLEALTENYSNKEKESLQFSYLKNLLIRLPDLEVDLNDSFTKELESVINSIPKNPEEFVYKHFMPQYHDLEYLVSKKFNLIPRKYHRKSVNTFLLPHIIGALFAGLSIALLSFILKNPAFAIVIAAPLSAVLTFLIKRMLDKKAEKEQRVL